MSRFEPKEVVGSGVWVARDGLERRRTLRERECGLVDWVLDWAMAGVMVLSLVNRWASYSVLVYWIFLLPKSQFVVQSKGVSMFQYMTWQQVSSFKSAARVRKPGIENHSW